MKVKGITFLILMLPFALLLVGCDIDLLLSPAGRPSISGDQGPSRDYDYGYQVAREVGGLQLVLQTAKESYSRGEPIPLRFEVINIGPTALKLTFTTSKKFDLIVTREGVTIWQLSLGKRYLQAFTEVTLEPDQALVFQAGWPQVDNAGNPVPAGDYELRALLTATGAGFPLQSAPLAIVITG